MDEDWITAEEYRVAVNGLDPEISIHQIERWRRNGLLPRPRQIGNGQGRGSRVIVPRASATQAQEIARLYSIREKRDWVGWQLWLRGYPVAERFWREAIEEAANSFIQFRKAGKAFARKMETEGETITAKAVLMAHASGLSAGIAKLPSDMVETVIGYGFEIACGTFSGLSLDSSAKPNRRDLAALIETIGAAAAESHQIDGNSIDFVGQIEAVLKEISLAISRTIRRPDISEPSIEARREFLMGLELGIQLNQLLKPIFRRNALGLGLFSRIAANPAIHTQAAMLIIWAEYREFSKTKLPFSDIEAMHLSVMQLAVNPSD